MPLDNSTAQDMPEPDCPENAEQNDQLQQECQDQGKILSLSEHTSLKYSLLGPSLTKSGQDSVDQAKVRTLRVQICITNAGLIDGLEQVSEIIYNASKGSKFFSHEEAKDRNLTRKIERILAKKAELEHQDLTQDCRMADDYVAELELQRDLSQTIVHIDCDAFYAAVEELDRPELKDVPMAVGKGVLTTCNYHARKFGCRSGMAGYIALRLCPQLICLPLNFEKYTAKAREIRAILAEYDPRFESASIDEAYLNITNYCNDHQMDATDVVTQLRAEVFEKTRISVSAGIAPNAKIAKIASNRNKPNGQFRVSNDRVAVMAFMRELAVRKVNGVGRVFERELKAIGIESCGDIYPHRAYLAKLFGEKAFQFLIACYLGLGRTKIQPAEEYERKSIGTESTFRDIGTPSELRGKLRWTAEELEKDMVKAQSKGRTLVLKIKFHTYEVLTRQTVPPRAIYHADDIYNHALPMLARLEREFPGMKLRLMGLRCTHLVSMKKPDVYDFFGFKRPFNGNDLKRKACVLEGSDEEWEVWPDEDAECTNEPDEDAECTNEPDEDAECTNEPDEDAECTNEPDDRGDTDLPEISGQGKLFDETSSRRMHGKEISPNPRKPDLEHPDEGFWDCPICSRPQIAREREFNEHIDFCLSRGTIKEVVKQGAEFNIALKRETRPISEKDGEGRSKSSKMRQFFGGTA
jgi:DNA polymerase kappa